MNRPTPTRPVVYTNKASCRDCYRCVRVCPVRAIRMQAGQAQVVEARCIGCGTCIRECPQKAKRYRDDLDRARALVEGPGTVAVSVAPAFAARLAAWERRRLPSALRKLGFHFVAETAAAAEAVARATTDAHRLRPGRPLVASACPAAVAYVERYRPERVDDLAPVPSPMLAHAASLKARLGPDCRVVFVGPCVAKKAEAQRADAEGLVDCVLTFEELARWLERTRVRLDACEESDFDEAAPATARLFPLTGGSLRTGGASSDLLDGGVLSASGFSEVDAALDALEAGEGVLLEPLFCEQGCINGPAFGRHAAGVFARRRDVLAHAAERGPGAGRAAAAPLAPPAATPEPDGRGPTAPPLPAVRRVATPVSAPPASEEAVRAELEAAGRGRPEDRLDCGACGYPSCRDKAEAVLAGMAEREMCIPTMRRLAERRTDRILETSPNGILVLDERFAILGMNPAFRRMFRCSEASCGRPVHHLMDPEPFERLAAGGDEPVEVTVHHERHELVCHQILYRLTEERQYVGIFVNVTRSRAAQRQLDRLRAETVMQAHELLDHQMDVARRLAEFLGESTAKGEALVENLLALAETPSLERAGPAEGWIWKTSSSR